MDSAQRDVEQRSTEGPRTLAEWKKPLLVTFVFLAIITTGFVSYTCVYFDRISERLDADGVELESTIVSLEPDRAENEDLSCEGDWEAWAISDITETRFIFRLDPREYFMYLNRPEGPELVVNNKVCSELQSFGLEFVFKLFEELQIRFGFDYAEELMARSLGMDNSDNQYDQDHIWTWGKLDNQRYYVDLKDSVLSYVTSDPTCDDLAEDERIYTRKIQFECPDVRVAKDQNFIEMGWMAVGPTTYLEKDAESLLDFSPYFNSSNVWRTLADDCIAGHVNFVKNLNIKSYCSKTTTDQENYTTNDSCTKIWEWPQKDKLIGFKIWHENDEWTLRYRYDHEETEESENYDYSSEEETDSD